MSKNPCFHCGLNCPTSKITSGSHVFCCHGCKMVFQLLKNHDLMAFYQIPERHSYTPTTKQGYAFLSHPEIMAQLLDFDQGKHQIVKFKVPSIHCSSCIFLLEQLEKFHPGIHSSTVNFTRKEVQVNFSKQQISLKHVAELLDGLGYPPRIQLDQQELTQNKYSTSLIYKIGYAGFAFGNIMFLSFPEYFDVNEFWLDQFKYLFRYLMLLLSLPVVFYAAKDYFISALKGIKYKQLNIDVPLAIGILTLFIRSIFEVIADSGSGYFDSLSGLVFFLLLGKYIQNKTYEFLSFEHDYKSYFPIGVTRLNDMHEEQSIPTKDIKAGDQLLIRHQEIIPVDGFLKSKEAKIDYSFVTGESQVIIVLKGEMVYAGGKQMGSSIVLESISSVQQSKLIQLWDHKVFQKISKKHVKSFVDQVAQYFTIIILVIALVTGLYWSIADSSFVWNTVTAVLIIACPCALALSGPFAFGNLSRILAKKGCFAKNNNTLEQLCKINAVVFDKTGTLTSNQKAEIKFIGKTLNQKEIQLIRSLVNQSNHPLSRLIYNHLPHQSNLPLIKFKAVPGQGMKALINGIPIEIGTAKFAGHQPINVTGTLVYLTLKNKPRGVFQINSHFRKAVKLLLKKLSHTYPITILSGDQDLSKSEFEAIIPNNIGLHFKQSPTDKLNHIKNMQSQGQRVLMVGDGLNDAGALAQSDIGIAVSEDINVFSPACDMILKADQLSELNNYIQLSKTTRGIVRWSLALSFTYNIIGLYFAVSGQLTPVVAAILMPLSSISVVAFVTGCTSVAGRNILAS